MSSRRFARVLSLVLIVIIGFLAGYFNDQFTAFLADKNTHIGLLSTSLLLLFCYCQFLRDKVNELKHGNVFLQERNEELCTRNYELRAEITEKIDESTARIFDYLKDLIKEKKPKISDQTAEQLIKEGSNLIKFLFRAP